MVSRTVVALLPVVLSVVSAALLETSQIRDKRQWNNGGWGQQGGWGGQGFQQQSWNNQNNRNNINAQANKYNCQTEGINLLGLPISEYNCQTSGQSAKVSMTQQTSQSQGFLQGPMAAIMSEFGGR